MLTGDPRDTRAASEIVGRTYLVLGAICAVQGRSVEAKEHFYAAAQLYERLDYENAAARAAWLGRQQTVEPIPDGLMKALTESGADAAVCLEAVTRYEAWRGGSPLASLQSPTSLDSTIWEGFVSEAKTVVAAKRPRWGEGRVTA